jgi:hypothetical protein
VTCNLSILLNGLDASEQPRLGTLSARIQTKDELVAKTKSLRIVGLGPSCRPPTKLKPILQDGDWGAIGLTTRQRNARARAKAIAELQQLLPQGKSFSTMCRHPPFTGLETVVLGQRVDCGWGHLKEDDQKLLQATQLRLAHFFASHRLRSICIHSTQGPYNLHGSLYSVDDPIANPLIITRHLYSSKVIPTVVSGAINRWILYPSSVWAGGADVVTTGRWEAISEVYTEIDRTCRLAKTYDFEASTKHTFIEFYGMGMEQANASLGLPESATLCSLPKLPNLCPFADAECTELRMEAFEERDRLRREEKRHNRDLGMALYCGYGQGGHLQTGSVEDWLHQVSFERWQDTPTCICCGWGLEDYREECLATLPADDEEGQRLLFGELNHWLEPEKMENEDGDHRDHCRDHCRDYSGTK